MNWRIELRLIEVMDRVHLMEGKHKIAGGPVWPMILSTKLYYDVNVLASLNIFFFNVC